MGTSVAQFISACNRFDNPCPGSASPTILQVGHLQCRYLDGKFQHKVKLLAPVVTEDVISSIMSINNLGLLVHKFDLICLCLKPI